MIRETIKCSCKGEDSDCDKCEGSGEIKMFDAGYEDKPICPYCGNRIDPSTQDDHVYYEDGDHIAVCGRCDSDFCVTTSISFTYSTGRIPCKVHQMKYYMTLFSIGNENSKREDKFTQHNECEICESREKVDIEYSLDIAIKTLDMYHRLLNCTNSSKGLLDSYVKHMKRVCEIIKSNGDEVPEKYGGYVE